MMYQMKVNQYERLSRKQRIRDSIQMFHNSFNESDQYLPSELRTPTRKVSTRSDDRRMHWDEEISSELFVDDNDEDRSSEFEDKAKKKNRSKKPKQYTDSSGFPNNDDDDEQSISLDQIYEPSPAQTHCTLNVSMNEDSLYMSDITDEDEPLDQTWESERSVKRKKSTKQRRRRSKSGKSLGEFDSSRLSVKKEKRRPRSEQNLGDSAGAKKSSRRKKKSRSLDPAPRSLHDSFSKSLKSKLRRPRDSMGKNEKPKRSKSEGKGKRRGRGRKSTRRKSETLSTSVTSDESPSSDSFDLLSESIDRFDSLRSLRRPRNSLLVNTPKSKKERKPRSARNRKPEVDRVSNWHNSTSF